MMNKSKQKIRSWCCVQDKPTSGALAYLKKLAGESNEVLVARPDIIAHLTGERSVLQ